MAHFEAEIPWFPNTYDKGGVYFVRFCRETCFFQKKLLKKGLFGRTPISGNLTLEGAGGQTRHLVNFRGTPEKFWDASF